MLKTLIENNPIVKLSVDFSLMVISYCENLEANRKFVIANQLLKSGTSIGANVMEAQNAESKADFIHKMKLAAKEAENRSTGFCCANIHQVIRSVRNWSPNWMKSKKC